MALRQGTLADPRTDHFELLLTAFTLVHRTQCDHSLFIFLAISCLVLVPVSVMAELLLLNGGKRTVGLRDERVTFRMLPGRQPLQLNVASHQESVALLALGWSTESW